MNGKLGQRVTTARKGSSPRTPLAGSVRVEPGSAVHIDFSVDVGTEILVINKAGKITDTVPGPKGHTSMGSPTRDTAFTRWEPRIYAGEGALQRSGKNADFVRALQLRAFVALTGRGKSSVFRESELQLRHKSEHLTGL